MSERLKDKLPSKPLSIGGAAFLVGLSLAGCGGIIGGEEKSGFYRVSADCPKTYRADIVEVFQPDSSNPQHPTVSLICEGPGDSLSAPNRMELINPDTLAGENLAATATGGVSIVYDYTSGGLDGQSPKIQLDAAEGYITISDFDKVLEVNQLLR